MKIFYVVITLSVVAVTHTTEYPACEIGGLQTHDGSGKILSPNYPQNYPSQLSCKWHLFPHTEKPSFAVVNLVDVEIEGAGCTRDKIVIDKATVCGNESNVCIVYKNSEEELGECEKELLVKKYDDCIKLNLAKWPVTVEFESDLWDNYKGFHIEYQFESCHVKEAEKTVNINDPNAANKIDNTNTIIGATVGAVAFLVLVTLAVILLVSRQKRINEKKEFKSPKEKEMLKENAYNVAV